tara:strand:- start:230 stop:1231 length:1002 start_codon:yes stop_codon:yes gene_type:complete
MEILASKICDTINGTLHGNPNTKILSFSSIKNAQKGDITFLSNNRYKKYLKSTKASIIIVPNIEINSEKTLIKVDNPIAKFCEILNIFFTHQVIKKGVSNKANIHSKSKIGDNVFIGDFSIIEENVSIGENCYIGPNTFVGQNTKIKSGSTIGPNVTIYDNTEIGQNCFLGAGSVIGSDGFGFYNSQNKLFKIPHLGKVIIKNNVEIGSNNTIDRGTFENTIIENGVKMDNLIQIAHNVIIGEHTVIAAQTGIAGSTKLGHHCMIGGQVAISEHLEIGNNVKIAGKSGVIKNVSNNSIIQGPLAFNIKDFQKSYIHFKNLDNLYSDIKKLKEK